MNNKGQALVEFIIILPIMIFIMLAIVDYGNMGYTKNKLENITNEISNMYKNNETDEEINNYIKRNDKDIVVNINKNEKYIKVKLEKKYNYITPGLAKIFKNNNIVIEREIYNEQNG